MKCYGKCSPDKAAFMLRQLTNAKPMTFQLHSFQNDSVGIQFRSFGTAPVGHQNRFTWKTSLTIELENIADRYQYETFRLFSIAQHYLVVVKH